MLQVLAGNLRQRADVACIVLRMGELASLHEGQLGHRVATRLVEIQESERDVPAEDEFGAGLGRLVPFVEALARDSGRKMLVIIDEFDDLNPAFYLGERGKQFVKALRSLSEVGLTFMFVGSERMNSIYQSHASDLNKWINRSLDRIEAVTDCEALITEPVTGKIEYDRDAVKRIVDYCKGNPFYMHLSPAKCSSGVHRNDGRSWGRATSNTCGVALSGSWGRPTSRISGGRAGARSGRKGTVGRRELSLPCLHRNIGIGGIRIP